MKIKNIAKFRTWYKNLVSTRKKHPEDWNENFMGFQHNETSGFFMMYHGDKEDIYGFLRKEVEMAEDGQAIFEFVQNAADCNSTDFYMFYNEKYFLAINNGEPFIKEGLKSILNIGQSHGKTDPNKIGRYGIGFKLVHRLVGASQGLDELLNKDGKGFRGPIMYSWPSVNQLVDLIQSNEINVSDLDDNSASWLLKILITNFPVMQDETILDIDYNEIVPFPNSELIELKDFLRTTIKNVDINKLNTGSLFFLKLGQGKYEYLEKQKEEYLDGITTSMHFLKGMKKICVNDIIIEKDNNATNILRVSLENGSQGFNEIKLTEKRDLESNINYDICFADNAKSADLIKKHPNIYKYFPAVKEINNLSLIIHSNVFELSSNRQNLTNTPINKRLLKKLTTLIMEEMDSFKLSNSLKYRSLYLSLLISDGSNSDSGNGWQDEYFYDILNEYIKYNVPTNTGNYIEHNNIVIKGTQLNINPKDFGVDKQWFYWNENDDLELIKESRKTEKLNLKKCNIAYLIEHGDVDLINEWISNAKDDELSIFIDELNTHIPKKKFNDIQFLKCSDDNFYSINEISNYNDVVILFDKINDVSSILNEVGLVTTHINLSYFENLKEAASEKIIYLKQIGEKHVFEDCIKQVTVSNSLSPNDKMLLFLAVDSLYGVGATLTCDWNLFCNSVGEIQPLMLLITSNITLETWLQRYQLKNEEYFPELIPYLIKLEHIFPIIICEFWNEIITYYEFNNSNIERFYESILKYYNADRQQTKTLTDRKYIYVENEFLEANSVVYHHKFKSINDYTNLSSALKKICGYKTPYANILKYLGKSPFFTKDDDIAELTGDATININEAYEFLRFCQKSEIKIFSKSAFSTNGKEINFKVDSKLKQYYSADVDLIEFIDNYASDVYVLLPGALADYKTTEGVLRNQELYESIIDNVENIYDLAEEFLPLLHHKDVIRNYISDLSKIQFSINDELTKGSFEYIVVSKILNTFDEDEFDNVNVNFVFEADDIDFKLSEITSSNDVQFDVDDKIYRLKVSEILPDSDSFSKIKHLDTLKDNLKSLDLPKGKTDKLFSVDIDDDDLIDKISSDLLDSLDDHVLINSTQVAFVLLYEINNQWDNFNDFQILLPKSKYILNDHWYTTDYSFSYSYIGDNYARVAEILNLNELNPIFKVNDDCILFVKPTFNDDGEFMCKYFKENLNDDECIDVFDFLYDEYNKRGKDSKRDFEAIEDWTKFDDTDTEKIIGFIPTDVIISVDEGYTIESENAPVWLKDWADNADKLKFLTVLGINDEDSDIFKIRKSIFDTIEITIEEIEDSNSLPDILLENTFEWLCVGELWTDSLVSEPEKVELLNAILNKLDWDEDDYWKIDMELLLLNSKEWEDSDYKKWLDEDESSFEINLLKGQLPYELIYDNNTVAVTNKNDYWFDNDNNVFYCNSEKSVLLLLQMCVEDGDIDADSIKSLINKGIERIKDLEEEVDRLKNLLNNENKFPEILPPVDSVPDPSNINPEATKLIIDYLSKRGYNFKNSTQNFNIIENVKKPDGKLITIICKSAQKGNLFFNPLEWLTLAKDDSQLYAQVSRSKIINIPFKNLEKSNGDFYMRFDTEVFGVSTNLVAFAEFFQYLKRTHFIFNTPVATAEILEEFGLNKVNKSSVEISDDDIDKLLH